MTRDDIIRMTSEAELERVASCCGITDKFCSQDTWRGNLERFASLVAAHEREECAKVCESYAQDQWSLYKGRAPYTGREEGRAHPDTQGRSDGADTCAAAIRARSQP